MDPVLHIVLVEPEIPTNTGNAGRTAVLLGLRLHLVRPLGFSLEDRYVRRAGLDYWRDVDLAVHDSWPQAASHLARFWLFSAHAHQLYTTVEYQRGDALVFGRESTGLPQALLAAHPQRALRVPMRAGQRSLNLSNTVAVAAYEALRQLGFPDLC
jgi:tRNA (cytidine/uridine-2'-O-)-methyltransferase